MLKLGDIVEFREFGSVLYIQMEFFYVGLHLTIVLQETYLEQLLLGAGWWNGLCDTDVSLYIFDAWFLSNREVCENLAIIIFAI